MGGMTGRWLLLASVVAAAGCALSEGNGRQAWGGEGGVFVSYHFGHGSEVGWGIGLEARVAYRRVCPDDLTGFWGGTFRVLLLDPRQGRLLLAPLYGGNSRYSEVSGELALGWELGGPRPGPVVQPGLDLEAIAINSKVGYAIARDLSMGLGLRLPGMLCTDE
jgi:hypothetical protein